MSKKVQSSISAENVFTKWIEVTNSDFVVEVGGTFVGTPDLQYEDVNGVWQSTGDTVIQSGKGRFNGVNPVKTKYRIGFPTGAYTSGSANMAIIADTNGDVEE